MAQILLGNSSLLEFGSDLCFEKINFFGEKSSYVCIKDKNVGFIILVQIFTRNAMRFLSYILEVDYLRVTHGIISQVV